MNPRPASPAGAPELESLMRRMRALLAAGERRIRGAGGLPVEDTSRGSHCRLIMELTAARFRTSVSRMCRPTRKQPAVLARQVAMALLWRHTDLPAPSIGALFGRDKTCVWHARRSVDQWAETDEKFSRLLSSLADEIARHESTPETTAA
ncbi:MAG: hypothetical protein KGR98_01715 [Verrucomicrobia bacterium]|nr:hypothetical protein [Verrucomicrobiota bacterium]MDE3099976.1 hypothetical protein [Verrucomicrobiota bacterium]